MSSRTAWVSDVDIQVGGVVFNCGYPLAGPPPPGQLVMIKTPEMVQPYLDLVEDLRPRRIMEIGIRLGGSTAFLHQLAEPERLVAVELNAAPAEALSQYIEQHGAGEVVRPHYGVDQADRDALRTIVDQEFGDEPLDLVIDDASHLYEPTLASFEELFPRLRPGGRYVIEDWAADFDGLGHWARVFANLPPAQQDELRRQRREGVLETPDAMLSLLTVELVLLRATKTDIVDDVVVSRHWTSITRGPGELQPGDFRLRDHFHDLMGLLEDIRPG